MNKICQNLSYTLAICILPVGLAHGDCLGTAKTNLPAVAQDEGVLIDACIEYDTSSDCQLQKGKKYQFSGIRVLPGYDNQYYYYLRKDNGRCYRAKDVDLNKKCDMGALKVELFGCGPQP